MADVYTLSIGLDASGALKGAADLSKATGDANKLIVELRNNTDKASEPMRRLGDGATSIAKQFGLAKGQLKEFGQIGASVFAGDILAKTLGFTSVLGALSAATSLLAEGIISAATALRDDLLPGFKRAEEEAAGFERALASVGDRLKQIRDAQLGRGATLSGPGGRSSFIPTTGLNLENEARVLKQVEDAMKRIQEAQRRNDSIIMGGVGNPLAGQPLTDVSKLYVEMAADALTLTGQLLKQQDAQSKIDALIKSQNDGMKEQIRLHSEGIKKANEAGQAALFRAEMEQRAARSAALNRAQRSSGAGSFLGGLGDLVPAGRDALMSALIPTREPRYGAGYGFGQNNTTFGAVMANGLDALIQKIPQGIAALDQFGRKQREIAENAAKMQLASDLGHRIAYGFEEAIFSGQKLSEVLRQLALDLARIVFRQTVTNQIAGFLTNAIGNGIGAGSGGSTGSTFPGFGPGDGGSSQGLMSGGTGGVGGGFRLSARQQRDNLARSF